MPIEALYEKNLLEQFYRIKKIIVTACDQKVNNLYEVIGFKKSDIEEQVSFGFITMLKPLGYNLDFKTITDNVTLPDNLSAFCDKFLNNPEAILHHDTSHQFYDRVHLLAALEHSKKIVFKNGEFTYSEILLTIVEKLIINIEHCEDAKRQIYMRFDLVEQDLQKRFNKICSIIPALYDKNHLNEKLKFLVQLKHSVNDIAEKFNWPDHYHGLFSGMPKGIVQLQKLLSADLCVENLEKTFNQVEATLNERSKKGSNPDTLKFYRDELGKINEISSQNIIFVGNLT